MATTRKEHAARRAAETQRRFDRLRAEYDARPVAERTDDQHRALIAAGTAASLAAHMLTLWSIPGARGVAARASHKAAKKLQRESLRFDQLRSEIPLDDPHRWIRLTTQENKLAAAHTEYARAVMREKDAQ